jgi:hypothetical protein
MTSLTARASLISNGGFETGDLTGWTYTGDIKSDLLLTSQFAHSGTFGAGVGPYGFIATLSQNFSTTIGTAYTLDFWLAADPPAGTGILPNALDVSIDGFATSLLSLTNSAAFPFSQYTYQFTATQSSTTLAFAVRNDPWGFSIDDVAVDATAVPEPGSLALAVVALAAAATTTKRFRP